LNRNDVKFLEIFGDNGENSQLFPIAINIETSGLK